MFSKRLRLIGAKIAFYRRLKYWTQLDLAEAAGLSEDYISKIETGKATGLTVVTALTIAAALERRLEDLTSEDN